MAAGFRTFWEPDSQECRAEVTTERVLAWLDTAPPRPFFLWVHYFDPHDAYSPPAPYDGMFPTDPRQISYLEENGFTYWDHPQIQKINCDYDGEVRYVDSQVGRVLERLRELRRLDDAAVVFTADHGEGMGQHDWVSHDELWDGMLRVPLIVKTPRMEPSATGRRSSLVAHVDLLPTLVEELGLPVPEEARARFEGRNGLRETGRAYVFSERTRSRPEKVGPGEKSALTGREWKYVYWSEGPDVLYDLVADPLETRNVLQEHPDVAEAMRLRIIARLRDGRSAEDEFEPSPEHLEELRALGYVD